MGNRHPPMWCLYTCKMLFELLALLDTTSCGYVCKCDAGDGISMQIEVLLLRYKHKLYEV